MQFRFDVPDPSSPEKRRNFLSLFQGAVSPQPVLLQTYPSRRCYYWAFLNLFSPAFFVSHWKVQWQLHKQGLLRRPLEEARNLRSVNMATPVSTDSPKNGRLRTGSEQERDLQEKVQHMISLQYQQQKLSNSNSDLIDGGDNTDGAYGFSHDSQKSDNAYIDGAGLTLSKRRNTKTNTNLLGLEDAADEHTRTKPLHPSIGDVKRGNESAIEHLDVGKGTIVFSGDLRGSKYASGGAISVDDKGGNSQQHEVRQEDSLRQNQYNEQYMQMLPPHSTTLGSQQQKNMISSQMPQVYPGYGSIQEQNHEFHYGNPDYQNIDEQDYYYDDDRRRNRRGGPNSSICARMYRPMIQVMSQENLHRSFCYGAIDGLLTGSGIASALWGLGLLSVQAPTELRVLVVIFTIGTCVADSLCMAMGHIWTTYIVTSNHAWERYYERQQLEQDKANSKAKLVDMLLARGMLKIDAMSLADTLEGYPDLFVSALVGDSLLSSGIKDALLDEPSDTEYQQQRHERSPVYSDPATDFDGAGGFLGSFASLKFPLHYNSERDSLCDGEIGHAHVVYQESQKEGIFMMLGFAIFATIPSLLWLLLPLWFNTDPTSQSSSSSSTSYNDGDDDSVNIPSLIILILSGIVWCLGVWKSRFVDSNWVVFGLETIAVLVMCISSAYGIAALLAYFIGHNDASTSILDKWISPP